MNISDQVSQSITLNDQSMQASIIGYSQSGLEQACVEIVTVINKILTAKQTNAVLKLRALNLLQSCIMPGNMLFLQLVEQKLLPNLVKLAKHKKNNTKPERGEDLFGEMSLSSIENKRASIDFLKSLLIYIQMWASRFGTGPNMQPSQFLLAYNHLLQEKVAFPSVQQANPTGGTNIDKFIESVRSTIAIVVEMISNGETGSDIFKELRSTLSNYKTTIEREVNNQKEEGNIIILFELNENINGLLSQTQPAPPQAQSPSKQQTINNLRAQIDQVKKKITAGMKHMQEQDQKINQLKQEIATIGGSKSSKILVTSSSSSDDEEDELRADNPNFYRACCCDTKGTLFENETVQLGVLIQDNSVRIFIGNKSDQPLENVRSEIVGFPKDGVKASIDVTVSDERIKPLKQVYRNILVEYTKPTLKVPYLKLGYLDKLYVLKIPYTLTRLFSPLGAPGDQIFSEWTRLVNTEKSVSFKMSGISSMQELAQYLLLAEKFAVFTAKEIPAMANGQLISAGQYGGHTVYSQISVESSHKADLRVRSQNILLRDVVFHSVNELLTGIVT